MQKYKIQWSAKKSLLLYMYLATKSKKKQISHGKVTQILPQNQKACFFRKAPGYFTKNESTKNGVLKNIY